MVIRNYPVRPQHHSLCVLMATRTEFAALQALKWALASASCKLVLQLGTLDAFGHRHAPPRRDCAKFVWKRCSLCFPRVRCIISAGFLPACCWAWTLPACCWAWTSQDRSVQPLPHVTTGGCSVTGMLSFGDSVLVLCWAQGSPPSQEWGKMQRSWRERISSVSWKCILTSLS